MPLSTFTFGRWCLPVFLGLSFLCFAQESGPHYVVILVGDDVPLLRGSTSPTSVITHVEAINNGVVEPPPITVGVTFFAANSSVQCKLVDGRPCYNVSVSGKRTHLYLRAPLSEGPIIKDTLVKLESRLEEFPEDSKNAIKLRTLDLTLTDNRRLHVGFTRRDTVNFDENGMATLYVMNHDAPLRLEDPLVMSISIRRSDDQRFMKQIRTNITFSDSNMSLPIIISGQALDSGQDRQYEATIIVQGEQSKYVRIDPASLQLAYSPYFELKKLFLEEIQKLEQNVTELKRKIDSLELLAERAANKSNYDLPTAATTTKATESTTATTADTESTAAAISVAPSSSFPPTLTSNPTTPTSSTSQDTVVSSADGDTGNYEPGNGSPDSTDPVTEPVTKDNKVVSDATIPSTQSSVIEDSTDDDTDDEVESNDSDAFMWWILGGFVVLMVATVAGYLLYNHRAKVMVYVGNVWKGGSDKLPTTQHQSRRKNKYTPLPTSIHDTLTHED